MGIDYSVWVGPFIRCKKTALRNVNKYHCPNPTCGNHRLLGSDIWAGKFCSLCGAPMIAMQEQVPISPMVIMEKTQEVLFFRHQNENEEFFFPSEIKENTKVKRLFYPRDEMSVRSFGNSEIEDELSNFKRVYKRVIEIVAEVYGEKNITIEWGVVTDAH